MWKPEYSKTKPTNFYRKAGKITVNRNLPRTRFHLKIWNSTTGYIKYLFLSFDLEYLNKSSRYPYLEYLNKSSRYTGPLIPIAFSSLSCDIIFCDSFFLLLAVIFIECIICCLGDYWLRLFSVIITWISHISRIQIKNQRILQL